MIGFKYPVTPHVRRHGPSGYRDYESYRDWLRDEFLFRCVYCLHREQWYNRGATFHIDHFIPTSVDPDCECSYSNLLYSCATCNEAKKAILGVPDPCVTGFGACLQVLSDGKVRSLNSDGEKLVQVLRLNSGLNVRYRSLLIRTFEALSEDHPEIIKEYFSFPANLPDLRIKNVPHNSLPSEVTRCCFALRELGELPETY